MENLALIFPYTATELTEQVDVIPPLYGMVNELDIFPTEGSISRVVELRYENHQLRVLPAKERGASATPAQSRTGQTIFVEIPHFPAQDLITPEDIQDILIQVGNTKRLTTVEEEVAKRLMDIKASHDVTREWVRAGALQGTILDGNSQTIYDLYTVFNISPTTIDFVLGTVSGGTYGTGTDVIDKCRQVWQAVTGGLRGEVMTGINAIVDPVFFNKLVEHPAVNKFWVNYMAAQEIAQLARQQRGGNMWGRKFQFQSINFLEYYGTAPVKSSPTASIASTPFWASGTGTAFPVGTRNMFRTYDGPAHDLRFVNTRGSEVYVSPKILDHGEGIELKSESNPLPICRRPEALVQLTTSN